MKVCTKCKVEKPIDDFYKAAKYKDGHMTQCKKCRYVAHALYRANGGLEKERLREQARKELNPNRSKDRRLKSKYDITLEQYNNMLQLQSNCCYLCKVSVDSGRRFVVDHDHETGAVRAILCNSCNVGIGLLNDNPELLVNAARYIEYFKQRIIKGDSSANY